ncbi:MAG: hypothetical protein ACQESR_15315 [Planctomycetota bacterium]
MERCPTQAVLPLVGLAAEKVIRDRYIVCLLFAKHQDYTTPRNSMRGPVRTLWRPNTVVAKQKWAIIGGER